MNKKAAISFIHLSILFVLQGNLYSQPDTYDFFPLKIGNTWIYEYYTSIPPPNGTRYRFRSEVTRDTVIDSKKYFFVTGNKQVSYYDTLKWFRIDTTNGNLLAFKPGISCRPGYELLIDSLASDSTDLAQVCNNQNLFRRCYQRYNYTLFNQQVELKVFNYSAIVSSDYKTYADKFGIIRCYSAEMNDFTITLLGCILDGIIYGDTTLIGIKPISNEIPRRFKLHQNYPNPFNPTTKICFGIPPLTSEARSYGVRGRIVRLIIYDLPGREVATLVNEQLKPGTYEVEWDGSAYASVVYFYSLITSEFTQTKKLILLK